MQIIGGPAANSLDIKVAEILGVKHLTAIHKLFPDGESYIRFSDTLDEEIVIIQSFYYPQDKHIIEFLLMADAARDLGVRKIIGVVPYLAYSRQDRRFLEGEAISVKTILRAIESAGVDVFITVDIHKGESLNYLSIPSYNIDPTRQISEYLKNNYNLMDPIILSPDAGGVEKAKRLALTLSTDFDYLEKTRDRSTGEVSLKLKSLNVKDRDVVIIDDIISTGGTIALAASSAKREGARKIYTVCTHALLVGTAVERIKKSGVDVLLATDTVPSPYSSITVAPLIADTLRKIIDG